MMRPEPLSRRTVVLAGVDLALFLEAVPPCLKEPLDLLEPLFLDANDRLPVLKC